MLERLERAISDFKGEPSNSNLVELQTELFRVTKVLHLMHFSRVRDFCQCSQKLQEISTFGSTFVLISSLLDAEFAEDVRHDVLDLIICHLKDLPPPTNNKRLPRTFI